MASSSHSLPQPGSPLGLALALSVLFVVLYAANSYLTVRYPKGVTLIREPPGAKRFSWRTRLAYYTDCRTLYREAYNEVRRRTPALESR